MTKLAVVSYDLTDTAAQKLTKMRGGLDDVIAALIIDFHIASYDVQSWCYEAIDEAVAEKKGA